MKRRRIAASLLIVAMTLTAVPFQAVLADETEETEEIIESEDEIIISEDETMIEEEEELSVEQIETEESDIVFEAANDVSGILINEVNFPDAIFRSYVAENYDDGDLVLSGDEINAVTYINVNRLGITDLSGIRFFTNLNSLSCMDNELTSLTIYNPHLQFLVCDNNNLTSLNIEYATALWILQCDHNSLTELDISNNKFLNTLSCADNQISNLILNDRVSCLVCYDNPLETIDVRFNLYLSYVIDAEGAPDGQGHVIYSRLYPIPDSISDIECYLKCDEDVAVLSIEIGWNKIDGNWYFFTYMTGFLKGWYSYVEYGGEGPYYFDETTGAMQTGWLKYGDNWYYFKSSGLMAEGWQKIGKNWYYFSETGTLRSDFGAMVTGWQKIGGKWYYFNASGAMATGWQKIGDKWYYFKSSGAMVTGWQKISNKWYYFESGGAMKTGWLKSGGKWYCFESSGIMLANCSKKIGGKTYNFNSNGVCLNP